MTTGLYLGEIIFNVIIDLFFIGFGWLLCRSYYIDKNRDERIKTLEQRSKILERIVEAKE